MMQRSRGLIAILVALGATGCSQSQPSTTPTARTGAGPAPVAGDSAGRPGAGPRTAPKATVIQHRQAVTDACVRVQGADQWYTSAPRDDRSRGPPRHPDRPPARIGPRRGEHTDGSLGAHGRMSSGRCRTARSRTPRSRSPSVQTQPADRLLLDVRLRQGLERRVDIGPLTARSAAARTGPHRSSATPRPEPHFYVDRSFR